MGLFNWLFGKCESSKSDKQVKYESFFEINEEGKKYEKKGEIESAIKTYEIGLQLNTDTPHTYKRLAILYRKRNDIENEIRVINSALSNLKKGNKHHEWFKDRKSKLA